MAIYVYKCKKKHTVEVRQKMSDDALTVCPKCGAETKRVIHAAGIVYKGDWPVRQKRGF